MKGNGILNQTSLLGMNSNTLRSDLVHLIPKLQIVHFK